MTKTIFFASDYRGIELRKSLIAYATHKGIPYEDVGIPEGSPLDYVDISRQLVKAMDGKDSLGILICGSGQGVSIEANRNPAIRAVICRTPQDAENARSKLNANVMCLGSKISTPEDAMSCLDTFLTTSFIEDKHQKSASKLSTLPTSHTYAGVNLIVRAIIIHEDHVLLTTTTSSNKEFSTGLYFLPGGHVDYTESAPLALTRELDEEMGVKVDHLDFAGALECTWDRKGKIYHELNLCYRTYISGLDLDNPPEAVDAVHQFVWMPIANLDSLTILPGKLLPIIHEAANTMGARSLFLSQMLPTG